MRLHFTYSSQMSVEGYLPKILPIYQSSTWQCLTWCCIVMVSVMSTVIIQLSSQPRPTSSHDPCAGRMKSSWTRIPIFSLLSECSGRWLAAAINPGQAPPVTSRSPQPSPDTTTLTYTCNYNYYNYNYSTLYTSKHVVHRDSRKLWNCGAWSVVIIAKVTSF